MNAIKAMLASAPVFVVLYIIFMIPTYLLPYTGSNSSIVGAGGLAAGAGMSPQFWMHLTALLFLCFICWIRGTSISKKWLVVFPVIALVFDIVPGLSLIPLVATVMHLLAIILGVVGARTAAQA